MAPTASPATRLLLLPPPRLLFTPQHAFVRSAVTATESRGCQGFVTSHGGGRNRVEGSAGRLLRVMAARGCPAVGAGSARLVRSFGRSQGLKPLPHQCRTLSLLHVQAGVSGSCCGVLRKELAAGREPSRRAGGADGLINQSLRVGWVESAGVTQSIRQKVHAQFSVIIRPGPSCFIG